MFFVCYLHYFTIAIISEVEYRKTPGTHSKSLSMNTAHCQFVVTWTLVTESITTEVNPGRLPGGVQPKFAYFLMSYPPCTCGYIYARDYSRCSGATFIVANHLSYQVVNKDLD